MATNYSEWLASDQHKTPVVLIIAEHSAGTVYFSDRGYASYTTDSPANTYFDDILIASVTIAETMQDTGAGSIGVYNDGTNDDWLDLIWEGYSIKVYFGDARWKFSNFVIEGNFLNAGISSPSFGRFRFKIKDWSSSLLSEEIGSELSPVLFGQCFNVPAVLIDSGTGLYKLNTSSTSSPTEVRDNGIALATPADYTYSDTDGDLTLVASPAGQVTADVARPKLLNAVIPDIITAGDSKVDVQLFDVPDALLVSPNANNTLMSGTGSMAVTTPLEGGDRIVDLVSAVSGDRAGVDIDSLVAGGALEDDTTLILTGEVKAVAGAEIWEIRLQPNSGGAVFDIASVRPTDTTYFPFSVGFIFGRTYSASQFEELRFSIPTSPAPGSFVGQIRIRNLQVWRAVVQIDGESLAGVTAQHVGIYSGKAITKKELLDDVINTAGAFYRFNSIGKMEINELKVPGTPTLSLTVDDIETNGISHVRSEPPIHKMILRYLKNYEVQSADSLAAAVSDDNRSLYSSEWSEVSKENSLSDYPVFRSVSYDSQYFTEAIAQAEVDRRQVIRSVTRDVFKVKTYNIASEVNIGDTVTITYNKYNLDSGVDMVVIGIKRNLGKKSIELTVWG